MDRLRKISIIFAAIAAVFLAASICISVIVRNRETDETLVQLGEYIDLLKPSRFAEKGEDGVYLIDTRGGERKTVFGPAEEIHVEADEQFARVRLSDGSWSVIDCRDGKPVLEGCSKILELPSIMVTGAAMRGGNVVVFSFASVDDFKILCEMPGFSDVDRVIGNTYVVVEKDGKYGVMIAYNGEEFIPPIYQTVKYLGRRENERRDRFRCRKNAFSFPKTYKFP